MILLGMLHVTVFYMYWSQAHHIMNNVLYISSGLNRLANVLWPNHTQYWHLLLLLQNYFSFYFSSDFSSVQEAIHWQCSMHTVYVFCGTLIWYMPSLCMHVLIVLLSLLCTWPTPTVLLEYTQLQLGCIGTDFYLHACEQLHAVKYASVPEAPAITTKASALYYFDSKLFCVLNE